MARTKKKSLSLLGKFLILMSVISFLIFYMIVLLSNSGYRMIDTDNMHLTQLDELTEGQPTAIITTDLGEIRVVLYPQYAPETVAQFTQLAQSGYYNGTYIFEAKEDVYFAAGSGNSLGDLPANAMDKGERVPQELTADLWPFQGALCAMNTVQEGNFFKKLMKEQKQFTGSRFMLLGSMDFQDESYLSEFREASGNPLLEHAFMELGGIPNLSQQVTVFGQTYAGFDVIREITSLELAAEKNENGFTPPVKDVKIVSVEISTYGEEDAAVNEILDIRQTVEQAAYDEIIAYQTEQETAE